METPLAQEKKLVAALAEARQQQGLTYDDMAKRTGLHRTAISKIERGERHMTLVNFLKICRALELDPDAVMAPGKRPSSTPTLSTPARHAPTLHEAARPLKDDTKKK